MMQWEARPLCPGVCAGRQRQDRDLQQQLERHSQLEEANGS